MTDAEVLLLGAEWFSDHPSGLNRYFQELLHALSVSGPAPRALVVGPASGAPDQVSAPALASDALPLRLWRYGRAVRSLARTAPVVNAHFALYAALPVATGALRHKPLVVHFHGPWAQESAAAGEPRLKIAVKRLVERGVYRRARALVVLSPAFKRVLVEAYGVSPWRVRVIPPGVDLSRFSPGAREASRRELGVPGEAWVAIAVRRLVPRMGMEVLLEAWAQLRAETERNDLLLLIAGEGLARPSLEADARRLRLGGSVRFLGRVDEERLLHLYRGADLCVVPSLALEGFGLVVLESLAAGTPVIASDVGGLPAALRRLDPSLLVAPGDPQALVARLRGVLEGAARVPDRQQCRTHAEQFSWHRVASATREVYTQAARTPARDRPRVVIVDHCARLSGAELALLRLLPALTQVEVHVVLAEDGPLVARLLEAGISVEVLPLAAPARDLRRVRIQPSRFPLSAGLVTAAYVVRLARRLRQLRPDLVHTYSLKAALYGGLAARVAGVPVVWHLHDRIATDYLPGPAVRMVRWLGPRLSEAIIANSYTTLATLQLARTRVRAQVIPYPLPLEPTHPVAARRPRADGEFQVGMVGRLNPWKGQELFLGAFARAFPCGPQRAVIVGAALFGEEGYRRQLEGQVVALGLQGRVEFAGFQEDVPHQLARFDALVHASVIPEPFGQVVVEGMAAGLPVVAAAAGGPAELVDDGVTGLLYPPGDEEALAALLRRLADDRALGSRLGAAGRRRARDFDPAVIAAQVVDVYRSVLAARRGRDAPGVFARGPGAGAP